MPKPRAVPSEFRSTLRRARNELLQSDDYDWLWDIFDLFSLGGNMSRLAEMKHKMRELGVADVIVDSLTEEEVNDAHDGPFIPAVCWKCDSEHRVSEGFVRRANLKTVEGKISVKCGICYL